MTTNPHQGRDFAEYQVDSTANLLAASVSELSGCSSDAMEAIELTPRDILRRVPVLDVQVLHSQINHAFTEGSDDE